MSAVLLPIVSEFETMYGRGNVVSLPVLVR